MTTTPQRTVGEVAVKTAALYIGVTIAYGHLLSLQGRRTRKWTPLHVCGFILLPVLPIVELLLDISRSISWRRYESNIAWYLNFLGIEYSARPSTVEIELEEQNTEPSSQNNQLQTTNEHLPADTAPREPFYSYLGRFMVVLACLVQSTLTTFLYIRRTRFAMKIHPLEYKCAQLAISGTVVSLLSLPLVFSRGKILPRSRPRRESVLILCISMACQRFFLEMFNTNPMLISWKFLASILKEIFFNPQGHNSSSLLSTFAYMAGTMAAVAELYVIWVHLSQIMTFGLLSRRGLRAATAHLLPVMVFAVFFLSTTLSTAGSLWMLQEIMACMEPFITIILTLNDVKHGGRDRRWFLEDKRDETWQTWKWKDPISEYLYVF